MEDRWKKVFHFPEKLKKDQLLILLLSGILLLVIAIPTGNKEPSTEKTTSVSEDENTGTDTLIDQTYVNYLEQHLAETLSMIEGAGKVTVMITLKSSSEKVVEKDLNLSDEHVTEADSQGGTRTTRNSDHEETTVYGSGNENSSNEEEPYVSKEISPQVEGVLVVASGGGNAIVKENITEAVQALFQIDTHKIRIMKMEEE